MEPGDSPETFRPEALFHRLGQRLFAEPGALAADGDHVLNADLLLPAGDYRDAAVLVPLIARAEAVTVLMTQRTPHLASHAGQVAFPGGKIDAGDAGPAAAAIREAGEEVGLSPGLVSVVGYLGSYLSRTGYRIVPVVARVDPGLVLAPNAAEVSDVFEVPLAFLMDPANHRRASRIFLGRERWFYEMPYQGRYIWGVTAGIVRAFYERVFV